MIVSLEEFGLIIWIYQQHSMVMFQHVRWLPDCIHNDPEEDWDLFVNFHTSGFLYVSMHEHIVYMCIHTSCTSLFLSRGMIFICYIRYTWWIHVKWIIGWCHTIAEPFFRYLDIHQKTIICIYIYIHNILIYIYIK